MTETIIMTLISIINSLQQPKPRKTSLSINWIVDRNNILVDKLTHLRSLINENDDGITEELEDIYRVAENAVYEWFKFACEKHKNPSS